MDERVALVTGAGQGVGRAIALASARQGARIVIVNDYVEERARRVAEEVTAMNIGVQGFPCQADVTQWAEVSRMIKEVADKFGSVDVLVNNAGNAGHAVADVMGSSREFVETDPDDWDAWVDVNFLAPNHCLAIFTAIHKLLKFVRNWSWNLRRLHPGNRDRHTEFTFQCFR